MDAETANAIATLWFEEAQRQRHFDAGFVAGSQSALADGLVEHVPTTEDWAVVAVRNQAPVILCLDAVALYRATPLLAAAHFSSFYERFGLGAITLTVNEARSNLRGQETLEREWTVSFEGARPTLIATETVLTDDPPREELFARTLAAAVGWAAPGAGAERRSPEPAAD